MSKTGAKTKPEPAEPPKFIAITDITVHNNGVEKTTNYYVQWLIDGKVSQVQVTREGFPVEANYGNRPLTIWRTPPKHPDGRYLDRRDPGYFDHYSDDLTQEPHKSEFEFVIEFVRREKLIEKAVEERQAKVDAKKRKEQTDLANATRAAIIGEAARLQNADLVNQVCALSEESLLNIANAARWNKTGFLITTV